MTVPVASVRETAVRTLRAARAATGQLVGGLGTAFQALGEIGRAHV